MRRSSTQLGTRENRRNKFKCLRLVLDCVASGTVPRRPRVSRRTVWEALLSPVGFYGCLLLFGEDYFTGYIKYDDTTLRVSILRNPLFEKHNISRRSQLSHHYAQE